MNTRKFIAPLFIATGLFLFSCGGSGEGEGTDSDSTQTSGFERQKNEGAVFADLQVLQYEVNGFDQLSLDQKKISLLFV